MFRQLYAFLLLDSLIVVHVCRFVCLFVCLDSLANRVWGRVVVASHSNDRCLGPREKKKKQNAQRYPEGTIKCPVRVTTACTKPE